MVTGSEMTRLRLHAFKKYKCARSYWQVAHRLSDTSPMESWTRVSLAQEIAPLWAGVRSNLEDRKETLIQENNVEPYSFRWQGGRLLAPHRRHHTCWLLPPGA